ncbi:hypothetical protein K491DRAFT_723139 [Lophiostoma macrostomum CBS 122681]|uniref:Uncharacterized protein n=1 Tax=Lophiostoma macrostomum CBS 122681 TaxID=1314788 RepID=A0A6A6SNM4_9PLEO|nr:hypothetical protein K491DRAFT_723139 [Lophiostoma macrostomum CBS 122681]
MADRQGMEDACTITRVVRSLCQKRTSQTQIVTPECLERWVGPATDPAVGLPNACQDNIGVDNGFSPPTGYAFAGFNAAVRCAIFFASSTTSIIVVRAWLHRDGIGLINVFGTGASSLLPPITATLTLARKNPHSRFNGMYWNCTLVEDSTTLSVPAALSLAMRLLSPTSPPHGWMDAMEDIADMAAFSESEQATITTTTAFSDEEEDRDIDSNLNALERVTNTART